MVLITLTLEIYLDDSECLYIWMTVKVYLDEIFVYCTMW